MFLCIVSCGTPETHDSVNYSSYNSTVEGATVTFWCSNNNITKEFISKCSRNASWTPDPVRQCSDITLIPAGIIIIETTIIVPACVIN